MEIKTESLVEWQAMLDAISTESSAMEVAKIIYRASGALDMEYINDDVMVCPRVTLPVWTGAGMPEYWPRPYICLPAGVNQFEVEDLLRFAEWLEETRAKA